LKAVVKLGGALFKRDPEVDAIRSMGKTLSSFVGEGNQLVAVAGGGQNARVYIDAARKLGADESTCDLLGIGLTRANAELFRLFFQSLTILLVRVRRLFWEVSSPGNRLTLSRLWPRK
jgi:uridylate kinase